QHIVQFNPSNFAGTFQTFGTFGSGSGEFDRPYGVAVDGSGNVYVVEFNNDRIDRFNVSDIAGTFISYGTFGSGIGQFDNPSSVALDSSGDIFVADTGNNRIVELTFAVPEPSTLVLACSGLVLSALWLGWLRCGVWGQS